MNNDKDFMRLMQCVFCGRDPEQCGCDEADEDPEGFCKKHIDGENSIWNRILKKWIEKK